MNNLTKIILDKILSEPIIQRQFVELELDAGYLTITTTSHVFSIKSNLISSEINIKTPTGVLEAKLNSEEELTNWIEKNW